MENKLLKNALPVLVMIIFLLISYFAIKEISDIIGASPRITEDKKEPLINSKTYEAISKPDDTQNTEVKLDDSGFGRENPFAPYK